MGLDNGIEVKRTEYTNSITELQQFNIDWDKNHKYDFEICAWRKCWNIRSMIFDTVEGTYDNGITGPLTTYDIDNIIKGLQAFNSDNWQDNGGSIWDWDDEEYPYSEHIRRDIENLQTLRKLMDKYDLEVYFYDSY